MVLMEKKREKTMINYTQFVFSFYYDFRLLRHKLGVLHIKTLGNSLVMTILKDDESE